MKFTIGTVSNSLDLSEDIKLIKSSLLYADELELIGMVEYAVFQYLPKKLLDPKDIDTMIQSWVPFLKSIDANGSKELALQLEVAGQQLQEYAPYLKKKKKRNRQELLAQLKIRQVEKQCQEQITKGLREFLVQPGIGDIQNLIDKEIVSVFNYGFDDFDVNELSGGYFANLLKTMKDGTAYPLFDKMSCDLIGNLADSKLIDIGKLNPDVMKHAGVASNILMTLPTLDAASVDEILTLKKENAIPLANFRKAIYEYSNEIQAMPWTEDFQYDCIKIYNTKVMPQVNEINEVMTNTSVLKNLGKKVLDDEEIRKAAGWTAAGLTTAITTSSNLAGVFNVLKGIILLAGLAGVSKQALTGFLKTASLVSEARTEVKQKQDDAGKNVMYYYYLASHMK